MTASTIRTTSFLVDDDVLIDAGTGVGDLTLDELAKIDHILVSHSHLDHVLSIGLLADCVARRRIDAPPIRVHALPATLAALRAHMFNGVIWPDFTSLPSAEQPLLESQRWRAARRSNFTTTERSSEINKDFHAIGMIAIIFVMPKASIALTRMPPATLLALERLGADLAVARLRRKESLASWALRLGVSVPTLMRMEGGEPGVGIGIYATALWLIGRGGALAELAAPQSDHGALELDVRAAVSLGKARAGASAQARLKRREAKAAARA